MNFRFLASAQAELLETISCYSAINGALGLRFEQAVANAVRGAVDNFSSMSTGLGFSGVVSPLFTT